MSRTIAIIIVALVIIGVVAIVVADNFVHKSLGGIKSEYHLEN
jgi:hypothetical protein